MMTILIHSEGKNRIENHHTTIRSVAHTIGKYNAFEYVISVYLILTTRKVNFCMTYDDIDNVNVNVIAAAVVLLFQVYIVAVAFSNILFHFRFSLSSFP